MAELTILEIIGEVSKTGAGPLMTNMEIDKIIDRIVHRIIATAQPRKIILFGSAVRGEMGPESDLDLLVVVAAGQHRRKTAQKIYRNLVGIGFAADIVVVTEEDIEKYKDHVGMVIQPALQTGRLLYAA